MIAPTSTYGCGGDSCVTCYGDEEWRRENLPAYWLEALFEFELCEECGKDADEHEVTLDPFGNFHATCLDGLCAVDGCTDSGEGDDAWDGYCGNHADVIEAHEEGEHRAEPREDCPHCEEEAP